MTVAGWGQEGGSSPGELMNVDVKVWSNEDCKKSYSREAPGGITDHMLCAGGNDKDSCIVSSRIFISSSKYS